MEPKSVERVTRFAIAVLTGVAFFIVFTLNSVTPSFAQVLKVSTDTLHNTDSDHKTEVNPTHSLGATPS